MSDSISSRIERIKAGKMTKSQRKLLEFFATVDYNKIIYMSITQLADATGVAEATVLRFCRSLGFNGYQEFKLRLAQDVISGGSEAEDSEYMEDIIQGYRAALSSCRKYLTAETVDRVIELIVSARTVCCCGVGHSRIAAEALHSRLLKMGIIDCYESDAHFQNILVSSRGAEDLLILFSVSGSTKDTLEVAEIASRNGMKIVVVTSYPDSPLAKYADVVLASDPVESPGAPGAMVSKVVQLFTVDVICQALLISDKPRFNDAIAKGNASTANKLV